ncbi:glycosyltransferase family 4 protein [Fibrella sp. WM1]|uniref:glycosyltransferase family 4 protein n=1 Tax=Fibrella musci TaxID=3242485 RepID=UPI0035226947
MRHIGIVGPVATSQLAPLLNLPMGNVPEGMGGVPVNNQVIELHRRGYRVSVFSNSYDVPAGQTIKLSGPNLDVYFCHYRRRARHRVLDLFKAERKGVTEAIQQAKPDMLHAHWQYEWGWAALDSGIPTLVTCHDSPIDVLVSMRDLYRTIRLGMAAYVLRRAKHLTAVSTYTANGVSRFTKRPVRVIPNFEPNSVFDLYRERQLPNVPSLVMVNNNFDKRKNVGVAMQAFKLFRQKFPVATLNLYGFGFGEGEAAHQWAQAHDCEENVRFHGPTNFNELMQAVSKHDLFLHTALEESCPMVLIEASAMGLPIVAGDKSGGVPWLLSNESGVLTDITSPQAVCEALEQLASDATYYRAMSQRARQNALDRFSPGTVVDQYLNAYEQLSQPQKSTAHSV